MSPSGAKNASEPTGQAGLLIKSTTSCKNPPGDRKPTSNAKAYGFVEKSCCQMRWVSDTHFRALHVCAVSDDSGKKVLQSKDAAVSGLITGISSGRCPKSASACHACISQGRRIWVGAHLEPG